jgi:hypothetical protein
VLRVHDVNHRGEMKTIKEVFVQIGENCLSSNTAGEWPAATLAGGAGNPAYLHLASE